MILVIHSCIIWVLGLVTTAGDDALSRDRPKQLFLVTAVTETGAEIQLLVSVVTVTRPKLTNDLSK